MLDMFMFWVMKAVAEIAVWLFVIVFFIAIYFVILFAIHVRQSRCKHGRVGESSACDAICTKCGKNLGFIGSWREREKS